MSFNFLKFAHESYQLNDNFLLNCNFYEYVYNTYHATLR